MIFNIQKCSVHDGDGLRTLVFFKGCPLRCPWCSNPESQLYEREIMESQVRCIGCGACRGVCPQSAIKQTAEGFLIDRSLCNHCFRCTDRCYAESKRVVGEDYTVEALFQEIAKDKLFYSMYGGGVTFSGGEPLTQPRFLTEIAKKCRENDIDVAVESCGYGIFDDFKEALPYINRMFLDIKHIDTHIHKTLTGLGNERILENIKAIATSGIPITLRTPIISGCNAEVENIKAIACFIAALPNVVSYELLPYHNLGQSKYKALGIPYSLQGTSSPSDEEVRAFVKCANTILQHHDKYCFYVKDNHKEVIK